ncbi:hypothetical protein HPB47_026481 [Ixodes persulcatus]|uniref:Uncharacterized protein n=1 Tax=Ixodes persulcatus TaxID=34615 RepID=A0AC60PYM6_IXOPE|nr:hypothetical protein HPB47_026481 [Ixodes persulcatus]
MAASENQLHTAVPIAAVRRVERRETRAAGDEPWAAMMTMDSCSTDQSIGELDSLSCNDDVHENFVEEYSVRVEVYETEVTGSSSAGSAPVIKISAPFTKSARPQVGQRTVCCYVHDDMKTSLKQAWGCTDLSIVHKILPPQQGNNAWTPVRPKCTEPMLREVYVSPCERYQGTISSMDAACRPMEPVGPVKLEQAMSIPRKARLTPSTVKLSTSRNPRCSVHKQTQTSPSQLELPNILKSLVDWIAFICQNPGAHTTDVLTKAKYLPHATSSQPGVTQSLQELLRTDSAVWWKLARQFHEGIAQFPRQVTEASASGRQKSYGTFQPRARMGGEGECAATRNENWKTKRPPVQRTELPRRLSSRLDLCIGANPCIDLEKDLVPQMNGSVVGHRRSCPIF